MPALDDTLRYGVLVSGTQLRRWQADVLDELDDIEGVELVVVVTDDRPARPTGRRPTRKNLDRVPWMLFDRWVTPRLRTLRTVDAAERFGHVPRVDARVTRSGFWEEFSDEEVAAVAAARPDFLLRFGFGAIRGAILDAAPLGVWSFHHGDERELRGGPPCFWELALGLPTTGVLFQRLTDRLDGGVPLARARFRTIPHSYRANRDQAYAGAVCLPAQVCRRVLAGDTYFVHGPPSPSDAPVRTPPGALQMARFLGRLPAVWVRQQWQGMARADRWHVGVIDRPPAEVVARGRLDGITWLPRPAEASRYLADPFGCTTGDGTELVIVEDLDYVDMHGTISAVRRRPDGTFGDPEPVAKLPTHVSYPGLVRVGDEWWIVPESAQANDVRALRFDPDRLAVTDEIVLMEDVSLKDPTLFEWEGRWWLMGTDGHRGSSTTLRAWWSDRPTGPWTLHRIDPLLVDVRGARPAGAPLVIDGVLHRPGQDNSTRYGAAVIVHRVEELTPERYREVEVAELRPEPDSPYPDGAHTLNALGERTLVDAVVTRVEWRHLARELAKLPRRLTHLR